MPTANKTSPPDAIAMLMDDHRKVKSLFRRFEKLKDQDISAAEKSAVVEQVCNELLIHATIEEEIFYPAVRDAIDDDDLMDEAEVEHASAHELIEQLKAMQPEDEQYDAKMIVLGEQIDHHIKEEEGNMFPQIKKSGLDTADLGAEMKERRQSLMEEMGLSDENDAATHAGAERYASAKKSTSHSKGARP